MKHINWKLLVFCIAMTQLAGIIGSFFTTPAIPTWYASLEKPFFSPPNVVFGPVWLTLYTLMGIALYMVWMAKSKKKKIALQVFYLQLGLNTLWSIIFFGFRSPGMGLLVILILWGSILITIMTFSKISKKASYLLYPYLLWVTFASLLNYYIWILN